MLQAVDQHLGSGNVGGNRNIVHIADAQQVHLVGLRGLSADGVTEEKQHVHFVAGDAGNDLLVTAVAARQKALYVQAGGFGHKPPRGTRGDQPVLAQNLPIGNAELTHQFCIAYRQILSEHRICR